MFQKLSNHKCLCLCFCLFCVVCETKFKMFHHCLQSLKEHYCFCFSKDSVSVSVCVSVCVCVSFTCLCLCKACCPVPAKKHCFIKFSVCCFTVCLSVLCENTVWPVCDLCLNQVSPLCALFVFHADLSLCSTLFPNCKRSLYGIESRKYFLFLVH